MSGSRRTGTAHGVWDTSGARLSEPRKSYYFPRRSVDVAKDRWLVDFRANRIISFLPDIIDVDICSAARHKSLAIGTPGGRVFVMHFPPAIFASSETRVEDRSRPMVRRT